MASHKVTIDVEGRFIDHISAEVAKAAKAIDALEKRKKVSVTIDAETKDADAKLGKTEGKAEDLRKTNPTVHVGAKDSASVKLAKIMDKAEALAKKVYTTTVKIKDSAALETLSKIGSKAESLTKKTWTMTLKVKDLALAPLNYLKNQIFSIKGLITGLVAGAAANKYVKQPTQMYADYEDLVTQFAVLLKGDSATPNYDAAKQRINELTAFAGQTPFTRDEIYQASRVLQTYTQGALATPDAPGGLRMIGDIAAATGHEYTQVATYMGRLYNEVKRGGETMGEPLAMLREMGALSAEQEEKIKEIAQGSGSIEERWADIAKQFSNVDGMMLEMSDQMNNLMLGVKSFLKNNLYMKLGEGISESLKPFLVDFRKWRNENKELIAGWANTIKTFAADASKRVLDLVRNLAKLGYEITQSDEFKNADLFGKVGMLWEGLVKNPIQDWWNKTVVPWWEETALPWISEKAGKVGNVIGTGLSNGLLALLGIDAGSAVEEGVSIGGSFVRGFMDGFDGAAVTDALVNAISNVWESLPTWAKLLLGTMGAGRLAGGISSLAGGLVGGMDTLRKLWLGIGSTGNAIVGGTGMLGGLADIGYSATGGVAGSTLGGGAAALAGLGTLAGAGVTAAGLISSANDLRKALKHNDDSALTNAHAGSGGLKIGGAALGAMIGTAILPGLGTALGAGIGTLAGWAGGGYMKKRAAKGASTAELQQWAKDSKEAAAELEARQAKIAAGMNEMFGTVELSLSEISAIVSGITTPRQAKAMQTFATAAQEAQNSMDSLSASSQAVDKWTWKAQMGFEFTEADTASYLASIEQYIAAGEELVADKEYEFNAAVSLVLGGNGPTKDKAALWNSSHEFYSGIQNALQENAEKLKVYVDGGEIEGKEQAIADLLQERAEIMQQVTQAENEAKLETLKIKYTSGEMSPESFAQLEAELGASLEEQTLTIDNALTTTLTSLKLQFPEGGAEYDEAVKKLTEGRTAQIEELQANANKVLFDVADGASGIDSSKLQKALNDSMQDGIQPIDWTEEQAKSYLDVESLEGLSVEALGAMLTSISETIPESSTVVGTAIATGIETSTNAALPAAADSIKSTAQTEIQSRFDDGFDVNTTIRVNPTITGLPAGFSISAGGRARGGLVGMNIPGFSGGGMVRGGAQLAMLAEEGTPEMVIPLGSQRRKRGLSLWEKAGSMLGVPGFANGGIAGDAGLRNHEYAGVTAGGGQNVQVDVGGVTVKVEVGGDGKGGIAEAIRAQGSEIADTIAGILADAFNAQFENTPVRGGA